MVADDPGERVGQRLSLKGYALTIRYNGHVNGKLGQWLGVEWDDSSRGKHDGSHDGHRYFTCASSSPTAASFLRPNQTWDPSQTFLQALTTKYFSEFSQGDVKTVTISGKEAQEIGFEKFARRQHELREIHVLVLDRHRIKHDALTEADKAEITRLCGEITEIDISGNLFEDIQEIINLCACLPKLKSLSLSSNRPRPIDWDSQTTEHPSGLRDLVMSDTLWLWTDLVALNLQWCPALQTLEARRNGWQSVDVAALPSHLHTIDLEGNVFCSIAAVQNVAQTSIRKLSLKHNKINAVGQLHADQIEDLDLGWNEINDFQFFDELASALPSLGHLRVTGNPLYSELKSPTGQLLSNEDGYMLTIARLPQLQTLNYSVISEKERLNAEVYYLNQIAAELGDVTPQNKTKVLRRHARWSDLCREYGDPTILIHSSQTPSLPPHSVLARAVAVTFQLRTTAKEATPFPQTGWSQILPKSCSIYMVLGIVGARLGIMPLHIRLFWETGERDPIHSSRDQGGPEWCDSDSSDGGSDDEPQEPDSSAWNDREVELTPGTRSLGTYLEGSSARVRVELIN